MILKKAPNLYTNISWRRAYVNKENVNFHIVAVKLYIIGTFPPNAHAADVKNRIFDKRG